MKAVLCKELGLPERLVVEDVASPNPGAGEVVVSVKAAGVNFPDTLIIQGKYQFKPALPFSPGGEVAGVVKQVGDGVTGVVPGQRVIAFTTYGGFAQEVVAEAGRLLPIPEGMDFVPASAFVLTYGTSYHALVDRAHIAAGESLLVLGAAGGVGLAAVQIGKALGARVIAAASTDEKLAVCKANGADELVNYKSQDLRSRVKEITGGRGVDVVYDAVGGTYSEAALRDMAWGGRFLVVGFAAGEIPRIPLNLTLLKGCSVVGVFWGNFTRFEPERSAHNLQVLSQWFSEGKVRPHIHATYPLEQAADALNDIMQARVTGKVVLVP